MIFIGENTEYINFKGETIEITPKILATQEAYHKFDEECLKKYGMSLRESLNNVLEGGEAMHNVTKEQYDYVGLIFSRLALIAFE